MCPDVGSPLQAGRRRHQRRLSARDPTRPLRASHPIAEYASREAGEDWREGGQPWPVRHVPTGRGCGAEGVVPKNPPPHRWAAAGPFAAMTAAHPVPSRSPDGTGVCCAGRSAPSQCEIVTGPGFSSPNQPDQERTTAYRDSSGPNSRSDAQGRCEAAEPLYKRALAVWEKALGPGDHPDVATTRHEPWQVMERGSIAVFRDGLPVDAWRHAGFRRGRSAVSAPYDGCSPVKARAFNCNLRRLTRSVRLPPGCGHGIESLTSNPRAREQPGPEADIVLDERS